LPTNKPIEAYGYPAVGRCIYCGTTDRRLTKEHIIAKAIGGNVTLAAASCAPPPGLKSKRRPPTCSEITRDIEQFCFRNMLGHFRHRVGFPTSQRQSTLPLTLVHPDNRIEVKDVDILDHIAMFAVPTFGAPGILAGHSGTDSCGSWAYVSNPETVRAQPAGTAVGRVEFHALTYARMLAKAAHAFVVAREGLDTYKYLLPDFILGKSSAKADFLVGCIVADLPAENTLHRVSLEEARVACGRRYLTVNIRLFAKFGAPQYHVVVAEFPGAAIQNR
jgi:hypothetical protein